VSCVASKLLHDQESVLQVCLIILRVMVASIGG
jgi:hypothetical protein